MGVLASRYEVVIGKQAFLDSGGDVARASRDFLNIEGKLGISASVNRRDGGKVSE